MRNFPKFLKLPSVAITKVLSSLSVIEILELTLCNPQMYKFVKESIAGQNDALEVKYEKTWDSEEHCMATSTRGGQNAVTITVLTTQEKHQRQRAWQEDLAERRCIERRRVLVQKEINNIDIIVKEEVFQVFREITDYLLALFVVPNPNLTLVVKMDNARNPPFIDNFINWKSAQRAETIEVSGGAMNKNEFSCFINKYFGNSTVKKNFTWSGVIFDAENFGCTHFPPLHSFSTVCTHYITPQVLYQFDIRIIYLRNCSFGVSLNFAHFNLFIKAWMEHISFQRNLEILLYKSGGATYTFIAEDLPLLDYDGRRRPEEYILIRKNKPVEIINCREGRDYVRDDGKVATLVIEEHEFFAFIVWPIES